MYQGIAKMHNPKWFAEDKDKLEKVLLELWPNSKINPRKMYYYIDNVKAFYPEIVHEALGKIVATQEHDRRPTIKQLVTACRDLVGNKYKDRDGGDQDARKDCDWCGYQTLTHVGLYIQSPEKCTAMDITGKNVMVLPDGWAVRPDWGHELKLDLKEYMVHCPHCSHPQFLRGLRSALNWDRRFGPFTEFRCMESGNTEHQWRQAFIIYQRMVSPVRPGEFTFDSINQEEARFHEYLESLPTLGEFEDRSMNVVTGEQPQADHPEWREEGKQPPRPTEEGEVLPTEEQGLS